MTSLTNEVLALEVRSRRQVAQGVVAIELSSADGASLPCWTPGAHIDLETRDASGNAVRRQYSLCGDVNSPTWRVAVLADAAGRGGSLWLHDHAKPGMKLVGSRPRNHFAMDADSDDPVVLVAGGIGITPLISMAKSLHECKRPFRLHYHVRRRQSAAFLEELMAAPYAQQVHLSIDKEAPCAVTDIFAPGDAAAWVYTCGPGGFMDAVAASAMQAGTASSRIRRELFAPAPVPAKKGLPTNRPFMVRLHSTGQSVQVREDQTVVQALALAGVEVLVSCEQGYCGSCLTRVLEGVPEHQDQFMLPEEHERNDAFTPCCSRALSSCLVLDL
jgi:vanillate O-demethylase ferredoxin subunit